MLPPGRAILREARPYFFLFDETAVKFIAGSSTPATLAHERSTGERKSKEDALATYGVAEITQTEGVTVVERRGDIELDRLSEQLQEIRNAINPIIADETQAEGGFGLQSLEISLTVGLDGKIWFIASGSVEASITMSFSRPEA